MTDEASEVPWATPADVTESWIGDDAPTDQQKIARWLRRAERKIRREVPTLGARLKAGEPDLRETVADVLVAMVTRVFRNPEGLRSTQASTGQYSQGTTYGGENPGTLELLASERDDLTGVRGGGGAFTIDTIPVTSPYSSHNSSAQAEAALWRGA